MQLNNSKDGAIIMLAGIGALMLLIELFSAWFVGILITSALALLGYSAFCKIEINRRAALANIRQQEFQQLIIKNEGYVFTHSEAVQGVYLPGVKNTSASETLVQNQCDTGETPDIDDETDGKGEGEAEQSVEEKIVSLDKAGMSKNKICAAVFKSKNKKNMDHINEVLGRI